MDEILWQYIYSTLSTGAALYRTSRQIHHNFWHSSLKHAQYFMKVITYFWCSIA